MKGDDCMNPRLAAVIYQHGYNDIELWQLDLPDSAVTEIEAILNKYVDTGCSVRGTVGEIAEELKWAE